MTEGSRPSVAKIGGARNDQVKAIVEPTTTYIESTRKELRQRWELSSVLHFLKVFESVIENDLKMSAEEIEAALIEPNSALGHLHKVLLKGILPTNKLLRDSDCWISALRKELMPWWHWVAEGGFPLAAKGKEMPTYNELDPTTRLLILKALCEVRADQPDIVSYMKEAMDDGTKVSAFKKNELAGDGKGIAFWYDGNEIIGHRLYKEVYLFERSRAKGKRSTLSLNCEWETVATNLEEFNEVVNKFSSSGVEYEVALSKSIEADVVPILKQHLRKKQKVKQKLKLRDEIPPVDFRCSGTRSCRTQKPIDYTFDNFDRVISEVIRSTIERKSSHQQRKEDKNNKHEGSDVADDSIHVEKEKQKEDGYGTMMVERLRPKHKNLMLLAHKSNNLRSTRMKLDGNRMPSAENHM